MKFVLSFIFIFYSLVSHSEIPNVFNITKPSSEALIAEIEGCTSGFKKGRIQAGRWNDTQEEQLLAVYTCACLSDAKRSLIKVGPQQNQKCLDYSSQYLLDVINKKQVSFNNIFNENEISVSKIQDAFYHCETIEKQKKERHWPQKYGQVGAYCSCTLDYLQEQKVKNMSQYFDSKLMFNYSIEKKCLNFAWERKSGK